MEAKLIFRVLLMGCKTKKYNSLVHWNEGSIRTISEAFDLAMEKETAYSNLARSSDELLLMASAGAQEEFVQRVSSAVCKNIRNETIRECDGGSETIPH